MNRLNFFLLSLAMCGCIGMTLAHADAFKPAPLFPQTEFHTKVLPNGVHTMIRVTPGSGVVSLQVWAEAGSRFETTANSGSTHLIEMLVMQGSRDYPTQKNGQNSGPQVQLENLGGQVSSATARDDVFWSATVASSGLASATKIMANAVLYPDLTDAGVAAAKTVSANDWMARRLDPVGYSSDLAYNEAFAQHPYRKPALGLLNSLKVLTGHAVRDYYKQRFTASHLHVVVVGDVDEAATAHLLEQYFGVAPKTLKPDAAVPAEALLQGKHQISLRGILPLEVVTLAWRSPGINIPRDTVATDILLTYLNEGSNAALRRVLQNGVAGDDSNDDGNAGGNTGGNTGGSPAANPSNALAGGFSADYLTQRDSGLFLISIVGPSDAAQATAAVQNLMHEAGQGLSAADLENAKTLLRRQYVAQANNDSGQAGALGFYDAISSYHFAVNYLDLVQQINSADIARVAQKVLNPDNVVQVTLLPALGNPQQQQDNSSPGIVASLAREEPRA